MMDFGDIETQLYSDGTFKKYPSLFVQDIPRKKDLEKGNLPKLEMINQIFLFVKSYDLDIKINTTFDFFFPYENIKDWIEVKCTLKYVSVNPSYEIDYIPRGYSALCLFEFEEGIPEIVNQLPVYMENNLKKFRLILTQKSVLEKILEKL